MPRPRLELTFFGGPRLTLDGRLLAEVLLSVARVERASGENERSGRAAESALHVPGTWYDARKDASRFLAALSRH